MKDKSSIITKNMDDCFICGRPRECIHHIYEGNGRRKISGRHGFIVPLCNYHHNMSDASVHCNKEIELSLKQECQRKFEETHTREEFMKIVGRNYL